MIYWYLQADKEYKLPNGSDVLEGFKKINIFVGSNNSWKSRFLRQIFLWEENNILYYDKNYNSELAKIYEWLPQEYQNFSVAIDLKNLINSRTWDYWLRFNSFIRKINWIKEKSHGIGNIWDLDVANSIRASINNFWLPQEIEVKNINNKSVYIPMLRGMRQIDMSTEKVDEKQDFYAMRTKKDYMFSFKDSNPKEIFSGASIYWDIRKMLLWSKDNRSFVKEFEDFLGENFFKWDSITLIPDHDTDSIKINIGDGEDRKIHDVGDGIQSIIISTFPAFRYQEKNLILCIEEPEMTMHPSIQRILIDTLAKFPNLQVFLTTHSNHFLDLSYDYPDEIAIFSFEKINETEFSVKNITENSIIIDLLGVRNSSVFLANCVIWTEGVTDRMLIRKLLELTKFNFKEDFHYAFAEYGGNNLDNFEYSDWQDDNLSALRVKSISKKNLVIIDNDNIDDSTNTKHKRRENIKRLIWKEQVFDWYIEIENLIPAIVWVKTIEKLIAQKPKKNIKLQNNYKDNLGLFNAKLKTEKIGLILKELIIENTATKKPDYFNSDGIQCLWEGKKYIMQLVIESIDELKINLSDFPQEAKDLVKAINKLVSASN